MFRICVMKTSTLSAPFILPQLHKSASLSLMRAMLSTLGAPVSSNTGTALSDEMEEPQTVSPNLDSMCQVQLVLKMENDSLEWKVKRMLHHLGQDRRFLFDSTKRQKYKHIIDEKFFPGCNWNYADIDMEEPEYTPSTNTINLNFILYEYSFPVEIIEFLRSDDWTVTGRHRISHNSHTSQDIVWGPWDYQLHEAPTRAALLADLEQLDKDAAILDREISDSRAISAIMPIVPIPSAPEERKELLRRTLADFRRRLFELVFNNNDLFSPDGGGGFVHHVIFCLRQVQLTPDLSLDTHLIFVFFAFIYCCQCVFETPVAKDIFNILKDGLDDVMPKEPFLSRFRQVVHTNRDFKSKWMHIIRTTFECMQYMESAPTSSEFMQLYPCHDLLNNINANIETREARKTELQVRRVDVLRNLAHLHPDTIDRGSPSPDLTHPHHASYDAGGASNKRKLDDMSTLLSLNATGSV